MDESRALTHGQHLAMSKDLHNKIVDCAGLPGLNVTR